MREAAWATPSKVAPVRVAASRRGAAWFPSLRPSPGGRGSSGTQLHENRNLERQLRPDAGGAGCGLAGARAAGPPAVAGDQVRGRAVPRRRVRGRRLQGRGRRPEVLQRRRGPAPRPSGSDAARPARCRTAPPRRATWRSGPPASRSPTCTCQRQLRRRRRLRLQAGLDGVAGRPRPHTAGRRPAAGAGRRLQRVPGGRGLRAGHPVPHGRAGPGRKRGRGSAPCCGWA